MTLFEVIKKYSRELLDWNDCLYASSKIILIKNKACLDSYSWQQKMATSMHESKQIVKIVVTLIHISNVELMLSIWLVIKWRDRYCSFTLICEHQKVISDPSRNFSTDRIKTHKQLDSSQRSCLLGHWDRSRAAGLNFILPHSCNSIRASHS